MTRLRAFVRLLGISVLAIGLGACLAFARTASDFYKGRTLTIYVGADPGGTYDLYARTIARYLGKHIPGSPQIIVENMPGAGGYTAALNVYSVEPQDGTAIAALGSALPFEPLIDPNSPKLDVPRINWIASASTYNVLMVVRAGSPIYSVDDLRKHETVMATIAPGQLNSVIVAATNATLGTKIKGVNGHLGLSSAMLALERGEIDGYPTMPVDAMKRQYSHLVSEGKLRVILQYGLAPSPDYPDVPFALNLVKKPADRQLLDLAQGPLKIGYSYMVGPDVPKDRIALLRSAFAATFKDPGFLADAKRQVLTVAPVSGEDIQKRLAQAYETPPSVVKRMRALYRNPLQ